MAGESWFQFQLQNPGKEEGHLPALIALPGRVHLPSIFRDRQALNNVLMPNTVTMILVAQVDGPRVLYSALPSFPIP